MAVDRSSGKEPADSPVERIAAPSRLKSAVPEAGARATEYAAASRAVAEEWAKAQELPRHESDAGADLFRGSGVAVKMREITTAAGTDVQRHTVENEDDLLKIADHVAGGSLDNLEQVKPDYWAGKLPDGTWRKVEFNLVGHANTNEGPHVKVMGLTDPTAEPAKGNRWKTEAKVFIEGRETWK